MILKILKTRSVIKLLLLRLSKLRLAFVHLQLCSGFTASLKRCISSEEKHWKVGRLCHGDAPVLIIVSMNNKSRYLSSVSSRKGSLASAG